MKEFPLCSDCVHEYAPLQAEPCGECLKAFFMDKSKPNFKKRWTNAERIRHMSDAELAGFFAENVDCATCRIHGPGCSVDCEKWILQWLQMEAEP